MSMISAESGAISASPEELRELAQRMYLESNVGRQIDLALRKDQIRADRPLRWLAVSHTAFAILVLAFIQSHGALGNPHALLLVLSGAALALAFWGLWGWSLFAPLPAAIVGLLMYISFSYLSVVMMGEHGHQAPLTVLFRLVTIVVLTMTIIKASRLRRDQIRASSDLPLERKEPKGIASAIWLYLFLLSIVVVPRGMSAENDMSIKDFFDIHKFMAIVTVTWALVAWRDTLPAIRKIPSLGWIGLGVLLGLGTFAVASIYGDLTGYLFDMPPGHAATVYLNGGYGWPTVFLMVAVFPAIFEELACRGVILPCLNRLMTTRESIAVSAMMFMLLHLSIPSAPPLLLVGIGTAIIRLRSKSIWPCVCLHFTHNAMCLIFEKMM